MTDRDFIKAAALKTRWLCGPAPDERIAEAKRILERLSKFEVSNSCQKFAAAVELAWRGEDVEVTGTERPDDRTFDVPVGRRSPYANWCLIRDGEFVKIPDGDPCTSIDGVMLGFGEGSRAVAFVTWRESGSGHVFDLAVIGGETYVLDATSRKLERVLDSEFLRENIDCGKSAGILRTDLGEVDPQMREDAFSGEGDEFSLSPDGPKRNSVTRLLSENGESGKSFRIYRRGKYVGAVRCDSVAREYGDGWCVVWNYSWLAPEG